MYWVWILFALIVITANGENYSPSELSEDEELVKINIIRLLQYYDNIMSRRDLKFGQQFDSLWQLVAITLGLTFLGVILGVFGVIVGKVWSSTENITASVDQQQERIGMLTRAQIREIVKKIERGEYRLKQKVFAHLRQLGAKLTVAYFEETSNIMPTHPSDWTSSSSPDSSPPGQAESSGLTQRRNRRGSVESVGLVTIPLPRDSDSPDSSPETNPPRTRHTETEADPERENVVDTQEGDDCPDMVSDFFLIRVKL